MRFEYLVGSPDRMTSSSVQEYLNKLGEKGWELMYITNQGRLVFKRDKDETWDEKGFEETDGEDWNKNAPNQSVNQ